MFQSVPKEESTNRCKKNSWPITCYDQYLCEFWWEPNHWSSLTPLFNIGVFLAKRRKLCSGFRSENQPRGHYWAKKKVKPMFAFLDSGDNIEHWLQIFLDIPKLLCRTNDLVAYSTKIWLTKYQMDRICFFTNLFTTKPEIVLPI